MNVDPLNQLAKALLDEERAQPSGLEPDAGAADRILGRLEALGLPPASSTPASASSGVAAQTVAASTAAKVGSHLLVLVLGAGLGVGGTLLATRPSSAPPPPLPSQPVVPVAPPEKTVVVEPAPAPAPPPEPLKVPPPTRVKSLLKDEQVLLDTARAAMMNHRFDEALEALGLHATRFPSGALTEEREALAVQTLAVSGRSDEARARAATFKQRFPSSIFLPAVDASLERLHE